MINVLVVAAAPPGRPHVFAESVRRLTDAGATVTLVGGFDAEEGEADHHLPPITRRDRAARPSNSRRLWLRSAADPWLRQAVRHTDVLVALDAAAVHTVWQFARRHRGLDAVLGLTPALRRVEELAASAVRLRARRLLAHGPSLDYTKDAVRGTLRRYGQTGARMATGPRVQSTSAGRAVWRAALHSPMPARARLPLARRVADGLAQAGFAEHAGSLLTTVAGKVPQPRNRARFLSSPALSELNSGRVPPYLREAITAELESADALLAERRPAAAAAAVDRAGKLVFHRALHYDSLSSPAAPDPSAFFAPWHRSKACQALAASRGRSAPAAPPPAGRPHRMLFLYRFNANFLGPIIDRYLVHPEVEMRSLDTFQDPRLENLAVDPEYYAKCVLGGAPALLDRVTEALGEHLAWADTVFVDWFSPAAGLLTLLDPGTTRVVVRLHSFEVFTPWPQIADLSRVDDVVFVSEHLRDYAKAIVPGLEKTRTWVLPHPAELNGFDRPKPADSRFTVGLVGISAMAKDPRWAVEVLRGLRAVDERYRLLLFGSDLRGDTSTSARLYQREFAKDLGELEADGSVVRLGQTDDVPAMLTEVGTILSSSVRESFHWGLVEGAASHAVPVVRDWPFFPGAAARLFPAEWVVGTPQEAVARILAATSSEETWRKTGAAAAAHAMRTWDHPETAPGYDRLLGIGAGISA